jgi:hypothetical protein
MLDRPYPNPAVDHALLRFAARSDEAVSLAVFDVGGRRVATLAGESRGDGLVRNVTWFTDDVPGGVYFAVLRVGDLRVSRKVVVAR